MGDRIVYLGPYNNSKKDDLFKKSAYYLEQNKGDKFYYILPNGKLLVKYRIKMIEEVGQTFDINLFTFDDIVDKLLENKFYTYIDGEIKEALLLKILKYLNTENKLKYYRNISSKKGFIKVISNIIGEIKRSLITPEIYIDKSPNTLFYKEIGLIYKEYEKWINKYELIDREGSFFKGLELLKEDNSFFNGLDFIIIDEFFDFRPQEMELLKEIARTNCSIYINMPFNREENFNTLIKTLDILKDLGFKIVDVKKEEQSYYEYMGDIVFSQKERTIKPNNNISMIKAPNNYLEMKKVSEEIKRHFTKGIDLKDMAIVLVNANEYKNITFQVFDEERIPCSLNKDISLIEIPLMKEVLHILELNINKGNKTSIINRVKSNYFSLCNREEKEIIEYILRKLQFSSVWELVGSNHLQSFNYAPIMEKVIIDLKDESKIIPKEANMGKYVELIMDIMKKHNIEDSIINIYNLTGDYDLLHKDFAALNKFKEVLNGLNNIANILYDTITLEEVVSLLENYLKNESIVDIQGNYKGVNILTPVTARGHKFKVLFVVGLSEGSYPNLVDENFFFNEEKYQELKYIGLDVKNYYEKLDKESLIFANLLSTCTDYLYLSYSENSTGDEKDIPSIFLDEMLRIIEGEKLEEKLKIINVGMDYLFKPKTEQLTTKEELSKYLLSKYYEEDYDEKQFFMYNHMDNFTFKEVNNRILCEIERNKDEFNQYNGNIGDENIIEDIRNIHEGKIYSISYLEAYARCPYYFLLNNILKVEGMERDLVDFAPLDKGIITHDVLKQYYSNYKIEIRNHVLGREIFDVDKTHKYIVEKIRQTMKSMGINIETNLWRLRIENNADRILNLVKADLDRLSKLKQKAIPVDFEIEFGTKEPFKIEVDGLKIPFSGAIDRMDKYVDEDKYILIDYKNSDYSVKDIDNMRSGLSLQLPLYILSQKNKKVIAAMYGIISKGEFQLKIGDIEEKHLVSKRNKGAITKEELEELLDVTKASIRSYINSIYKGDFSVNPKECSPFCTYKDICRYKEDLEVEKWGIQNNKN